MYDNERLLLEANGYEVIRCEHHNDDIDDIGLWKRVRLGLQTSWSFRAYREIDALIRRTRPHIAHFHNTFPQISPSGYAACRANGIPVVQTLHNFRLICPNGLLLRDAKPCEECVGKVPLPALKHRCYRNSLPATASLTLMLMVNRLKGSYRNNVDQYIALTDFAASRLVAGGIPESRVTVKPNFLPDPPDPGAGAGGYAVYVGRLTPEKGVETMLRAWRKLPDLPLKIAGDGALLESLRRFADKEKLSVEFLGYQPRARTMDLIKNAMFQVVPSDCYEGLPMAIIEAYACGTPVLAARIGSLDEIVDERAGCMKFSPHDPDSLAEAARRMSRNRGRSSEGRRAVRRLFDRFYTAERNIELLHGIYRRLATRSDGGGFNGAGTIVRRSVGSRLIDGIARRAADVAPDESERTRDLTAPP